MFAVRAIGNNTSPVMTDILLFSDQDDEISFVVKSPWELSNNQEYTPEHTCKNQCAITACRIFLINFMSLFSHPILTHMEFFNYDVNQTRVKNM